MRILVFGDNASEVMGGEATKPIRLFRGYRARGHACILVTHERCKAELKALFTADEMEHVRFIRETVFHRGFHFLDRIVPLDLGLLVPLVSQIVLCRLLKRREFGDFDVIHQATPISVLMPSALAGLDCPTMFGPLAIQPDNPPSWGSRREVLRRKWRRPAGALANLVFRGKRQAAMLYCDNEQSLAALAGIVPAYVPRKMELVNGLDDFWTDDVPCIRPTRAPKFVFAGRLVGWKRVDMMIDAAGQFGDTVDLVIIGDGPERRGLEAHARRYPNINATFTGWQSRQAIRSHYASATGVVSLALQEAGGTSVQEAMASGVPLIASAWGGHLSRVTEETALLVFPASRCTMVAQTALHMRRLSEDPVLAERVGKAARDCALDTMLWSEKIDLFLSDIQQILSGRDGHHSP